jgi:hypothetical protein
MGEHTAAFILADSVIDTLPVIHLIRAFLHGSILSQHVLDGHLMQDDSAG